VGAGIVRVAVAVVVAAEAVRSAITPPATSRSTGTTSSTAAPDIRVRGTSQQLFEKYLQLGRDATSGGDRVMAESYFQHAEHYFRILNAMNQAAQQGQQSNGGQYQQGQRRPYGNEDEMSPGGSPEIEPAAPGMGDQPEAREIPIAAAPPEG